MVRGEVARNKLLWTSVAIILGLCLMILVWFLMVPKNGPAAQAEATASPTQTQQPSSSPTTTAPAPILTISAISGLEKALNSGNDVDIRSVLPMAAHETVDREFTTQVSALQLALDSTTMTLVDTGLWEVQAADASGDSWDLGIVLVEDSPQLVYAERSEN